MRSSHQFTQQPAPSLISSGGQPAHGQPSATNNETPTVLGWGFFLPDRADSRVFAGIPAEACGLRHPAYGTVRGHLPLSPGRFSALLNFKWVAGHEG